MSALDHAAALLSMAGKDLRALAGMAADPDTFADEVFGFHAQQAVEKALKAWLAMEDVEYPKTHDLRLLLALLQDRGRDVVSFWDLVELTTFAVQLRYEAYDVAGEPLDRATMSARVGALLKHVENLLGASTSR